MAIVSARMSIGSSLNRRLIAEGLETREQFMFFKSHKCGEGQACRTPYLEHEHEEAPAHKGRIAGYPKMRPNPDTLAIVPG